MWKLALGFVAFAAISLVVLKNAGGNLDMGGEKHGIEVTEQAASAPKT